MDTSITSSNPALQSWKRRDAGQHFGARVGLVFLKPEESFEHDASLVRPKSGSGSRLFVSFFADQFKNRSAAVPAAATFARKTQCTKFNRLIKSRCLLRLGQPRSVVTVLRCAPFFEVNTLGAGKIRA